MKIDAEMEEIEIDDEWVDRISILSFKGSRKDLEELGKFFLESSKSLPTHAMGNDRKVSYSYLNNFSDHFKDSEFSIFAELDFDEI
jgi:hypothetical protein